MSQVGERKDAPEIEDVEDAGQSDEQGADESGSDEGDADDIGEESDDGDADHGDDDDAGEDEGQGGQPPQVAAKPRSAATIAVQEAKRAAKEAKAEAEATRRELEQLRQQRQQVQTEEQRRAEAERIALMAPEEKTEYLLNKQKQEFDGRFGQLQFQMQDNADRVAFDSLCARDPALAAVRDEAEQKLQELRRQGGTSTREIIATYLIGQKARERAAKGGFAKQKAKGKERVASAKSQPTAGRSDVRGGERRGLSGKSALEERLKDVQI